MLNKRYEVVPINGIEYKFDCECENKIINKKVAYSNMELNFNGKSVYNIAFGPFDNKGNIIDDIKTNNVDLIRTLSTVAYTSIDFTDKVKNIIIHAKGFNQARTRLYQWNINKFYDDINQHFVIFGITKELKIELFNKKRTNYHYEAFLAEIK